MRFDNNYSLLFFYMFVISHMRSEELTFVKMYDMNSVFNKETKPAEVKSSPYFRKKYENSFLLIMIYLCIADCAYYLTTHAYFSGKNKTKIISLLNTQKLLDIIYNVIKLQENDKTDINIFANISFDENIKIKIIEIVDKLYKQIFSSIVNDEIMMTSTFVNNEIIMYNFLKEKENQDSQINNYITSFYKNYGFNKFTSSEEIAPSLLNYYTTTNLANIPDTPCIIQFISSSGSKEKIDLLHILCQSLNVDTQMMKNTLNTAYMKVIKQIGADNKTSYVFMKTGNNISNNINGINLHNTQKQVSGGGTRKKNQSKKHNTKKGFMKGGVWEAVAIASGSIKAGQVIYATAEAVTVTAATLASQGITLVPASMSIQGAIQYVAVATAVPSGGSSAVVYAAGAAIIAASGAAYYMYNQNKDENAKSKENEHDKYDEKERIEGINKIKTALETVEEVIKQIEDELSLIDEEEKAEQQRMQQERMKLEENRIQLEEELMQLEQSQKNIKNNVIIPQYENSNAISDTENHVNDKSEQRSTQINNEYDRLERKKEFYDKNPEYWKEVKSLFAGNTHNTEVEGVDYWYNYMSGNAVNEKPDALINYESLDQNPEFWGEITDNGETYWRNFRTRRISFEKPDTLKNWDNRNALLVSTDKQERAERKDVFRKIQGEPDDKMQLENEHDDGKGSIADFPKNGEGYNDKQQLYKPVRDKPIIISEIAIGGLVILLLYNYFFGKKTTYIPNVVKEQQILYDLQRDLNDKIKNIDNVLQLIYNRTEDLNVASILTPPYTENDINTLLAFSNKYCGEKNNKTISISSLKCLYETLTILKQMYEYSVDDCAKHIVRINDLIKSETDNRMEFGNTRQDITADTYMLLNYIDNISKYSRELLFTIYKAASIRVDKETEAELVNHIYSEDGDISALYVINDNNVNNDNNDNNVNNDNNDIMHHILTHRPDTDRRIIESTNQTLINNRVGDNRVGDNRVGGKIKASRKSKHGCKIKTSRKLKHGKRKLTRKYKK